VTVSGPVDYPPAQHMLRDLRLEFEHGGEGRESRAWMPAQAHLADRMGNVRLGALATLVDVIGGGLAALAAAPAWIATADLSLHVTGALPADGRANVAAIARVLRAGRTTVVLECDLGTEPADGSVARATMTFSVLERRAMNPIVLAHPGRTPARTSMGHGGSGFRAPFLDALGIRSVGAGISEVAPTPYVLNSFGAVQGGVLAAIAEHAAETLHADGTTVDLQVASLALARTGPVRATAAAVDAGDVARVEVVDLGAQRRTTVALARRGRP
jgi:uncharacterized protein (TIGR00369 family)